MDEDKEEEGIEVDNRGGIRQLPKPKSHNNT
jgi:hypothetical protein